MSDTNSRTRLLRACFSFMLPVARFLLRSGISYTEFSEISRMAFVQIAGDDYGLRGRPTNISRIAAMTGIGRKDVRRLRSMSAEYAHTPSVDLSPLGDVLQHWFTDKTYLDSAGQPRVLPMQRGKVSFERLVRTCAGDIPVGAVKVELIRWGSIKEEADGRLRALRRHLIPVGADERLATALAFGLRGLASTIAFNTGRTDRGSSGRIERLCLSDGLSEAAIQALHPVLRERLTDFLESIDNTVSTAERLKGGRRIGVGVFYYEDD